MTATFADIVQIVAFCCVLLFLVAITQDRDNKR